MRLELPLCPSTNVYWRNYRGITVLSDEAKEFKTNVRYQAMTHGYREPMGDEMVVCITYHPKARQKETEKPLRRRDVDNCIKPTLDALNGIAWHDDYQVVDVRARLGNPVKGGKLVVEWSSANFIGNQHEVSE